MLSPKSSRISVRGANRIDELRDLIFQIPTILGRLIHIACLWNPLTGRYDRGLPARFLGIETEEALHYWHRAFFFQWLAQSADEKQQDVTFYWNSVGGALNQIKAIRELAEEAIPRLVSLEERKVFIKDLDCVDCFGVPSGSGGSARFVASIKKGPRPPQTPPVGLATVRRSC